MPHSTDALLAAAAAHAAAGRAAPALRAYADALARDPDHPLALLKVAEHALASGRPADALAPLERATAAAQRRGGPVRDIHFALGRAHMALGAPAAALPAFRRMLAAAPGDVAATLAVASAAIGSGDAPGAESRSFFSSSRAAALRALTAVSTRLVADSRSAALTSRATPWMARMFWTFVTCGSMAMTSSARVAMKSGQPASVRTAASFTSGLVLVAALETATRVS